MKYHYSFTTDNLEVIKELRDAIHGRFVELSVRYNGLRGSLPETHPEMIHTRAMIEGMTKAMRGDNYSTEEEE